ncbi:hypothetical protein ACZ90_71400 [Streptomyces albus subsp. albus]|nr:hypothetical protein ACZ90_71400 [Streptomyces albus subsp. albus]
MLATGATACGVVENISAGKKLSDAADRLGERKSLSVTFDIGATPDQLVELSKAEPGADPLPRNKAELLAGLRVTLAVRTRTSVAKAEDEDVLGSRLTLAGPHGDLAEYRLIGKTAYYRADLAAIGDLTGDPMPTEADLDALLPEDQGGFAGMRKIIEGKWVKVDTAKARKALSELEEMSPEAGEDGAGEGPSGPPAPVPDPETGRKMLHAVKGVLAREVRIRDKGSRDGVTHLVATGPVRTLLTGIVGKLRPLTKDIPGGPELPTAKDLKEVPDARIAIDFSVEDGVLSGADTDLGPLFGQRKKGQRLPLSLEFGEAGKISAPAGATAIDLREVMMGLGAAALHDIEGADDADFSVDDEDLPADEGFPAEDADF